MALLGRNTKLIFLTLSSLGLSITNDDILNPQRPWSPNVLAKHLVMNVFKILAIVKTSYFVIFSLKYTVAESINLNPCIKAVSFNLIHNCDLPKNPQSR
ncbi:hypothetical protein AOQ84DRAFT_33393 [Glonium stellatum]|uniref:Uncharacterized protein n=1 Tax=Glonium stellatum TaxID=574774 RepID=A0A8E2F1Y0_9PEZI|nr:hypothetical protein AOQ84DRAFT_33393 [Glonium stellatum]